MYVAHHPNDLARRLIADDDLIIQRIAIRPEPLRERLINDDHWRPALVPLRKRAAAHYGNFEGLEVAGRDQRPSRDPAGSRSFRTSRDLEASLHAVLQRHTTGS